MKSQLLAGLAAVVLASGCSSSDSTGNLIPLVPSPLASIFQNPFMSPNPTNNLHGDSYLSDSYPYAGPTSAGQSQVSQLDLASFADPVTGEQRTLVLGEMAGQAYDAQGNIQSIAAGLPDLITDSFRRSLVTIDRSTLKVLAYGSFVSPGVSLTDFGGAGYFYQDNRYRMVVALPDGHVQVLARQHSTVSEVDAYVPELDYNVTGSGGAVAAPAGVSSLSLYALVPDKLGNIWWTTGEGVVGTITPSGQIFAYDINTPNGQGARVAQSDGGFETIANSHAVDEGDGEGLPSGVYILTTYNLYRFSAGPDGTPRVDWKAPYDRGTGIKPGQVSYGSGTSPTVFQMNGRRFVTIGDNAVFMNLNVYRAEARLQPGENRLFAQVAPFGANAQVSDENSLVVAPAPEGGTSIYAENNYGYTGFSATSGDGVTQPGFVRTLLRPDGSFTVASLNSNVRVPTVVSKVSVPSNTLYTYEKQPEGWYLVGLDATDLNQERFRVPTGPSPQFNNHYSALSLDSDGRTVFVGTAFGLTRIVP